jgi:hypothetical protein
MTVDLTWSCADQMSVGQMFFDQKTWIRLKTILILSAKLFQTKAVKQFTSLQWLIQLLLTTSSPTEVSVLKNIILCHRIIFWISFMDNKAFLKYSNSNSYSKIVLSICHSYKVFYHWHFHNNECVCLWTCRVFLDKSNFCRLGYKLTYITSTSCFNWDESVASFCHQVVAWVPCIFCNFCSVKNHKFDTTQQPPQLEAK